MEYQEFEDYQHHQLPFGQPAFNSEDLLYFEHNEAYREDLLATAQFYIETIAHNNAYLNIPLGFVFGSENSMNAKAGVHEGRGLIVWNAGLLLKQIKIKEKENEIQQALTGSELAALLPQLDNLPSTLFSQSLQHFTFYHEFAHIIQLQEREGIQTMTYAIEAEYNDTKHLLELNADEFAALALSSHIDQYTAGLFEKVSKENLSQMLSLFLVPILTESISVYPDDLTDFNLQKGVHPHPLVRLLHTSITMMNVLDQRYAHEFKLDSGQILGETLEIAANLTGMDLRSLWKDNLKVIMEYFDASKNSPFPQGYIDPIAKWNEEIHAREKPN